MERDVLVVRRQQADKNQRKKRGRFRPVISVKFPRGVVGFPDRLRTTLKYSQAFTFSGTATPSGQAMMVNSCFDPDVTGTGHQPSFYDSFCSAAGPYQRYFVKAFKVR